MVTVVIPAYNYARFLPDAIDSALAQADPGLEIEVLVIDDGSTDETPQVAARYGNRIRYHRQDNAGLSAARNTGMREAKHDLVVFLDADDLLAPGAVAALLEARNRMDPKPAVVGGKCVDFCDNEMPAMESSQPGKEMIELSATDLVIRNRFSPTTIVDPSRLLAIGGFDISLPASEDRDMWIRVATTSKVSFLDTVICYKRDHPTNMSKAAKRQTESILRVLEKAFSDPRINLSENHKNLAMAICHYQSSLMYAAGERPDLAALGTIRSLMRWPKPLPAPAVPAEWNRMKTVALSLFRAFFKSAPKGARRRRHHDATPIP